MLWQNLRIYSIMEHSRIPYRVGKLSTLNIDRILRDIGKQYFVFIGKEGKRSNKAKCRLAFSLAVKKERPINIYVLQLLTFTLSVIRGENSIADCTQNQYKIKILREIKVYKSLQAFKYMKRENRSETQYYVLLLFSLFSPSETLSKFVSTSRIGIFKY